MIHRHVHYDYDDDFYFRITLSSCFVANFVCSSVIVVSDFFYLLICSELLSLLTSVVTLRWYMPPKSDEINLLWSNNHVRLVIELIYLQK